MIAKDKGRKWMWCLLGALVTLPFYFVQQLVAAFAFFAIGFAAIAFVIVSLYLLQKGWELAVARLFRYASAWNSSAGELRERRRRSLARFRESGSAGLPNTRSLRSGGTRTRLTGIS